MNRKSAKPVAKPVVRQPLPVLFSPHPVLGVPSGPVSYDPAEPSDVIKVPNSSEPPPAPPPSAPASPQTFQINPDGSITPVA